MTDRELHEFLVMLYRRRPDGSRVHSDQALGALVPILFLLGGGSATLELGSPLTRALEKFAGEAQLQAGQKPKAVQAAAQKWLQAHPLSPELVEDVHQFLLQRGSAASEEAAALLGITASSLPVGARPAPAGSIKGGPLARFQSGDPSTKKK